MQSSGPISESAAVSAEKRVAESALVLGLIALLLWVADSIDILPLNIALGASKPVLILSIATIGLGLGAFFFVGRAYTRIFSQLALTCAMILALTMISSTGDVWSPYIVVWAIAAVFAGVYGFFGIATATLFSVGYMLFVARNSAQADADSLFLAAFMLAAPILVSYLFWGLRALQKKEKDQEFTSLSNTLSYVATQSEIVISNMKDGVIVIDKKANLQLINPAAQTFIGWGKDDAIGLNYQSVLKLADSKDQRLEAERNPIQQTLTSRQHLASEDYKIITTSGRMVPIKLDITPVASKPESIVVMFQNITGEAAANKERAEFISTASHEMRTPVAAIEGYLGLALNPNTATIDIRARDYLSKAHESSQHLGRLFQDLLDVTKTEDGRLKNNPVVVDLGPIVRDTVQSFANQARDHGLELHYALDIRQGQGTVQPLYQAAIDIDHFEEVLGNLIENAIKYTKVGSVTVDVKGTTDKVMVSITDTGIGIPAEDLPHLFQKFYRVDNTDTREIGGTGLGLFLSRRLVESMGGRLDVESTLGKGTTFTVSLIRAREDSKLPPMVTFKDGK